MADFPNASTTGVRDGVTLTRVNGTFFTSFDGQVISGIDADEIVVRNDNVTITDCRVGSITTGTVPSNVTTNTTIEYCDIYGKSSTNSISMEADGSIVRFNDISGSENGIWLEADRVLIEDNYIHNLFSNGGNPDPHIDGIQVPGSNIGAAVSSDDIIRHNAIILDVRTATSCFISLDVDNVTIDNNYLSGGAAVVYFLGNANAVLTNNVFNEFAFMYLDAEVGNQTTVPNPVSGPFIISGNVDVNGNLLSINNTGGSTTGSVAINNVSVAEGNSGTTLETFTVTRSGGTAAFDVTFATSNGTAIAGSDYVATTSVLHFNANQNTATISVTVNGDTTIEANETFNVNLSNATNGATISDSQGVGTITNDDGAAIAGSVSINDVTVSEGDGGTTVATFTVTRSGGTAAFDVNYATSNGTATVADSDYVAASSTLHFGANQNTQTISVTINGDTRVEGNETFNVGLSNATNGATISDSQGVGTITDDDAAPPPPPPPGSNLVVNGGFETGSFSGWTLSGNTGGIYMAPTQFPGASHSGTYSAGFGSFNSDGTITQNIATTAGQHYTFSFWIMPDNDGMTPVNHFDAQWNGQTLLNLINTPNASYQMYSFDVVGNGGTSVLEFGGFNNPDAWRLDDVSLIAVGAPPPPPPPPPPVAGSISIGDATISEGNGGTQLATFTVTRAGGTAAFDVSFGTSDGTATVADSDYMATSGVLNFAVGQNTATISVTINGDTTVEPNETFNVGLSNATNGATISDSQGVGTITNDDAAAIAGSASINNVTISEGDSGTKVATFTVTRSGGTAAFDVNYATSDGTATVADGDYVAASNTVHFGANQNTQTISVTINGDTTVEPNETFNVALSNATNGATISDSQGVGTITNDDAAAIAGSASINSVTISEGDSGTKVATFTVTRSGGTAAFDVNYATSDGTATVADGDYVAASNTLHFEANQNTQTISVTINGDTTVEPNETFNVVLSNATNGAAISDSQGVGTITNDDSAPTANLVVNGGFETGNFSGWTLSGNSSGNQIYIAPTAFPGEVHTGSYSAGLGSINRTDGILTQNIATTAGQHYTLSFWIESDNNGSTPINHFVAEWNGQTLMALTDAPNSSYQLYTFDVVGINGNSVLEFDAYNHPDAWRLDDVTLTAAGVAVPAIFTSGADTVTLPLLGGTFNALGGDDKLAYTGGPVTTDGGMGIDTVDFSQFNSAVWVNLSYNGPEIRTQDRPDLSSGSWRAIGDLTNVENLVGTVYSDFLQGDNGANTLQDGDGNDTLTGGSGADTFVFDHLGADSQHQHDVIVDFQPGVDRIDLAATPVTDFGDLFTFGNRYMEQVGDDVLIHTSVSGDTSILLQNMQLASLTQSNFLF